MSPTIASVLSSLASLMSRLVNPRIVMITPD